MQEAPTPPRPMQLYRGATYSRISQEQKATAHQKVRAAERAPTRGLPPSPQIIQTNKT